VTPIVLSIGELTAAHWAQVRRIYEQGLATGHASFETSAPSWEAWDDAHLPSPRIVAVHGGAIVGWAALTPVSRRPVYAGVAEVSVYVDPAHRRAGVGRLLLSELVRRAEAAGLWTLQAGIFPENAASCRLHERCGFRLVGRRERIGRHHGVWRDTLLYERRAALPDNAGRG